VHRVEVVVCLLSNAELRAIGVSRSYGDEVRGAGLQFLQLGIVEMFAPETMEPAEALIREVVALAGAGKKCVIHCRGGVGRAGMLAACCLMQMGLASSPAQVLPALVFFWGISTCYRDDVVLSLMEGSAESRPCPGDQDRSAAEM